MKKIAALLLTLSTVFALVACGKKKNKSTTSKTTTAGKTTTAQKTTENINPDDYLTPDVKGNLIKNGNFNNGDKEIASSGDELIGNWWVYGITGHGKINVNKKHQLELGVIQMEPQMHSIQLAYDGFKLFKGNSYTLEFDACATEERHIEVRVQKNGGSYENYMLAGGVKEEDTIVKLTTEMQHFKFEFTTDFQDKAPRLAINCGYFKDQGDKLVEKAKYSLDTDTMTLTYYPNQTITFDNVVLLCTHDEGIRIDELNRPMITLNQVGFTTWGVKEAVFRKAADKELDTAYDIVNVDTEAVVFSASVTPLEGKNESSNEVCGYADFTSFKTPGKYKIVGNNSGESYEFEIRDDVYGDIAKDTIMMLYKQRCGTVLGEEGDKFAHAACHQSQATIYGTNKKIDVSGGWHDAGDYGKYVVAGAQTVQDLLLTYEQYGDVFTYDSYVTGTDENIPDILEEAMWELDWMLKMQTEDGGVYHKVTTLTFPENNVSAVKDTGPLYVSPVSYAATADFAAVMARASLILQDSGIALDKANVYKEAAIKAYAALGTKVEMKSFANPSDPVYGQVKTGEYPDGDLYDELTWASIELYNLTADEQYLDTFYANYTKTDELGLGWANVNGFAIQSYLEYMNSSTETYATILNVLLAEADKLVENSTKDVYNITLGKTEVDGEEIYQFEWGSNLTIANNAMILDFASWYSSTSKDYFDTLQKQINYLLGQNANCYCFVTGYGTLSPKNPHHRPSIIAHAAMPGMLVGGPDSNFDENGNDAIATNNCEGEAPALCYIDNDNSWSTNEITIYWNSPLTYILYAVSFD